MIRDLGSGEPVFVQRAVRELKSNQTRGKSRLSDGTLDGASLSGADLHGLDLPNALLRGTDFATPA